MVICLAYCIWSPQCIKDPLKTFKKDILNFNISIANEL